jgi:hypothetical protein
MGRLLVWLPWIVIAAVSAVFVAVVAYAILAEQKRKKLVEEGARALKLDHSPALTGSDKLLFDGFALAQIGRARAATSATTADSGDLRIVIFDYQYTVGSGKNSSTRSYAVVMAISPQLQLPQFSLVPETFAHRVADFFGFKDIDFEEDAPFSDQFLLKGEQEGAIRSFFTSARRTRLVALGPVQIEATGNCVIVYRSGKQRNADDLRGLLEIGFNVAGTLREPIS